MTRLSNHCHTRTQQRAIDPAVIEMLIFLGVEIDIDNEACKLAIPKREKQNIIKMLKKLTRAVEKSPYAVLSHNGLVITAAHKHN